MAYDNIRFYLTRALCKYTQEVRRYRDNSATWKSERTWVSYWHRMNALEEAIDLLLNKCEEEGIFVSDKTLAKYENLQEIRYNVTMRATV